MATKRMFANSVINSGRFMKMPISSQLLYFHLSLQADDDGIVEAYSVLKMTNLSEDDLKILVAKGFAVVLNEDLVTFITDWNVHNSIRSDRKVDSRYKDLLLRMVPNIALIERRSRVDLKTPDPDPSFEILDSTLTADGQHMSTDGQPVDGIGLGLDIDKDRLDKNRLGKDSIDGNIPWQEILSAWNNLPQEIDKIRSITDKRKDKVRVRIMNLDLSIDDIKTAFHNISNSSFLKGYNKDSWKVSFDWLFENDNNFIKVLEDKYKENTKPGSPTPSGSKGQPQGRNYSPSEIDNLEKMLTGRT